MSVHEQLRGWIEAANETLEKLNAMTDERDRLRAALAVIKAKASSAARLPQTIRTPDENTLAGIYKVCEEALQ